MRETRCGYRLLGFRALIVLAALWSSGWTASAMAAVIRLDRPPCHAVTAVTASDNGRPPAFTCHGTPTDYEHGSLWYRIDLRRIPVDRADVTLMVRVSRFDRLAVAFAYADGTIARQQVRGGDFGSNWRAGGQIAFEAPAGRAPLVAMTIRFDRVASANLLRMRVMSRGESSLQSSALAALTGAALMLLLIGAVYSASLALAVRRQFPAWQAAWAGSMVLWGTVWSQFHLFVLPGMAGTTSAELCTSLSCLAITFATFSAITALDRKDLPDWAAAATLVLGSVIGVLGVPLALIRSSRIETMADILGMVILADLVAVGLCLGWAWRRGSTEARAYAGAWSVPMVALGGVQFIDTDPLFWGGGAQMLVLCAAAWQTLWVSIAATRTLARIRIERDTARSAEAHAHELARRDPLTGLRNRRGFIEAVMPILDRSPADRGPIALLIIDIDLFKSINDSHGHEAGDMVLSTIAHRLNRWDGPMITVARLGGEEFGMMIDGVEGFALSQFADSLRLEIAACDHSAAIGDRTVTVSIGIAATSREADFQHLYRLADEALYASKRQGRNQVVVRVLPHRDDAPNRSARIAISQ